MRFRFYAVFVLLLLSAVIAVDAWWGELYARYMILFSGAVFLGGMAVGQRSEREWIRRRREVFGGRKAAASRKVSAAREVAQ